MSWSAVVQTQRAVGERSLSDRGARASGPPPRAVVREGAAGAGTGRITLSVVGLDALLEALAARHIDREAIETYSNGVRHVKIPDPDGNAIAVAEPPDVA